jgi:hypothetical protein
MWLREDSLEEMIRRKILETGIRKPTRRALLLALVTFHPKSSGRPTLRLPSDPTNNNNP